MESKQYESFPSRSDDHGYNSEVHELIQRLERTNYHGVLMHLDDHGDNSEVHELSQRLERTNYHGVLMLKYKGFWCLLVQLVPAIRCQKHFIAHDTDIILATLPKSGTTWLKAIVFSIINRARYPLDQTPLLITNPHLLVPSLEDGIYRDSENPDLSQIPDPRIFSTHVHYESLPSTIMESECRIIHICRNPLDQFIFLWHFWNMISATGPVPVDEFLETFCEGTHIYGPFWDLMLGYWNAHLKNPEKVLFLKYEDLKKDINYNVKRIADFIGFPFSLEEEKAGSVEEIAKLCSFDELKNLEVNKVGILHSQFKNSYYFRKGEIGDWANYLSPSMVERIESVVEEKFRGSGLKF